MYKKSLFMFLTMIITIIAFTGSQGRQYYQYDTFGRLERVTYVRSSNLDWVAVVYVYDPNGNILQKQTNLPCYDINDISILVSQWNSENSILPIIEELNCP